MTISLPAFDPLTTEGLTIVPHLLDGVLRVTISGAVEMREPGDVLTPYWNRVDEEARRRKVQRVEVDLRGLNFMNSSGILTLVRWITRAKGHGADSYQMVLLYDRNVTWQRTSVPTLAKLAPNLVIPAEIDG
jgi:hypothetical protein